MKAITASMLLGLAMAAGPTSGLARENGSDEPADREELRAELAQAREELAEAARRMAELQRQFATPGDAFSFAWKIDDEGEERGPIEIEQLRMFADGKLKDLKLWPPRLGVLLGSDEDEDPRTVVGLTPGGGAGEAGIKRGDVLVAIDGQAIGREEVDRIQSVLSEHEPGDMVSVEVLRDGERMAFDVETSSSINEDIRVIVKRAESIRGPDGKFRIDFSMPPLPPIPAFAPHFPALGSNTELVPNHEGLHEYFGTGEGVLVIRIDGDNVFGLRDGDVILTIDRESVDRPVDLGRKLMAHDPGAKVTLEVMRGGVLTELQGTVPNRPDPAWRLQRLRFHSPEEPEAPQAPPPARPGTRGEF